MSLEADAQKLAEIANKSVNNYSTYDFGREKDFQAKSVIVEEKNAKNILLEVKKQISSETIAFIGTTRNYATNERGKAEIVIAEVQSQFDILKLARCDALNYGLSTEDIINKLISYDCQYGIDIFQVETDLVNFMLKTIPSNLTEFCQDLYDFCPDIVDQGVGTIPELETSIEITGEVFLWWD